MRVLLISPLTGVVGGISIWTRNIVEKVKCQSGVELQICDFSRKITGRMIANPVSKISCAIRDYWLLTKDTISVIKKYDGDIVHLCSSASFLLIRDWLIIRAAKRRGLKICIHFHFGRIPEIAYNRNWEWRLLKKVAEKADAAIVMDKLSFKTLNRIPNICSFLLPNPLSDTVVKVINSISTTRQSRTVLFAGHCILTKGVLELVSACKSIPGIKLTMVGAISTEMTEQIMSLAGEDNSWLEIKGQVSHEETIAYMKSCDIFVLPTYTEGFPNVILESMACGCPIIASGVGAIPEMLEEENCKRYGIVIEPRNIQQLKIAIETFISDDNFKMECGQNAQARVIERYSIEKVCNQLNEIWEQTQKC